MDKRFYIVIVAEGCEEEVVNEASVKIKDRNLPIYSLIIPPETKGMIIVEAEKGNIVKKVFQEIRYVREVFFGFLYLDEVQKFIKGEIED